jgi:plastocyanin
MSRRGAARIRLALVMGIGAALLGTGVALAQTSEVIVANADETFSKAIYTADQGAVVQFQNNGGTHNVTARQNGPGGDPLFQSADTSGGATTPVNGTSFLGAGDYAFYCMFHPDTMNATLRVTGAGTAQPRPQASLTLPRKSLSRAIKKGIAVSITANVPIDGVKLAAKFGKATIGKATVSLVAGSQIKLIKLSKAGKRKLAGRDTAKVTVLAEIPFSSPASAKAKLT